MLTYLDDCGAPYMLVSKILFGKVKAGELFIPSLILMRYMYFKSLKFRFYAPCKQALKAPSSPRNWGWWFVGMFILIYQHTISLHNNWLLIYLRYTTILSFLKVPNTGRMFWRKKLSIMILQFCYELKHFVNDTFFSTAMSFIKRECFQ